jgi:ribonucleotide reductase beta subunit family protein with ferritin-like domain
MTSKTQIQTPTDSYVVRYPQAEKARIAQQKILWTAEELNVGKDSYDFHNKLSEGEYNAVVTLQKILTKYELIIGGESMWGVKLPTLFPRPEIQAMCATFAYVELGVHAPFYKETNDVLGTATDDFYNQVHTDPVLSKHIEYLASFENSNDPLEVTAALAFLEGVVLFSAFAFLKTFNSRGYNMIPQFVTGIDSSVKDEDLHAQASSWLFRQTLAEMEVTEEEKAVIHLKVMEMAKHAVEHEMAMVDLLYEVAPETIRTCNIDELRGFILHRSSVVLHYLGVAESIVPCIMADWFYKDVNSTKINDFFSQTSTQYQNSFSKEALTFDL